MCQSQVVPLFRQTPAPKKTEQQKKQNEKKKNESRPTQKKCPLTRINGDVRQTVQGSVRERSLFILLL